MAQKFKLGDPVRQVMPAPIEGVVVGYDLDKSTGDVQFQVSWTDDDGTHSRHFTEAQIEAVEN